MGKVTYALHSNEDPEFIDQEHEQIIPTPMIFDACWNGTP